MAKSPKIRTNEGPPDQRVQIISVPVARPDSTYPLIMSPYKVDLSQFGDKVRDEMSFEIKNVSDQDLDIKLIARAGEFFEVELPDKIKAGETEEAHIKLTDKAISESFKKSLTIEVNDTKGSRFTIPVKRDLLRPAQAASAEPPQKVGSRSTNSQTSSSSNKGKKPSTTNKKSEDSGRQ